MRACGLIVEYNPFHNGHLYHVEQAKKVTESDCMIAVMSGSFLQRGEPAIMDKFHRTRAALHNGIDIVLELPYVYAVQNSDIFANGAVRILNEIGVNNICFGSESGDIDLFIKAYESFKEKEAIFKETLKSNLNTGISFPEASKRAYSKIGLTNNLIDLSMPNNILGFSYVKAILENNLPIIPLTIKRLKSQYHDNIMESPIASATSIRKELFTYKKINQSIQTTLPEETVQQLTLYQETSQTWHQWESYFPILQYRVLTMTIQELQQIHGVNEGIEYRIKSTAKKANSFSQWVEMVKTKRYTWTRIQRLFAHILTNTKKEDVRSFLDNPTIPYIRVLGITEKGRKYLNNQRKRIEKPIVFNYSRNNVRMLELEERVSLAYYSILSPLVQQTLFKQELKGPILK